jgi:hypothetical protein
MGGGGSSSSGESWSRTAPGFMEELSQVLNSSLSGTTGFGKQDAINDIQGVIQQQAINTMQEALPKIAGTERAAGAYNSTTRGLLGNDLQARIAGQAMATTSQAIKDYAAIDADRIRAFASASQAGTGSEMHHWESAKSRGSSPFASMFGDVGRAVVGGALDNITEKPAAYQNGGRVPTPTEQAMLKWLDDFNQLDNAAKADLIEKKWADDAKAGKFKYLDGGNPPPERANKFFAPGSEEPKPQKTEKRNKDKPLVQNDDLDLFSLIGNT